jgi:LmbE family N-acetylglucosaminyl deacetylase
MRFIGIHEYEHWTGYKGKEDYFREKLIYELLRVLRERKYTKIVTHNINGEYGHPRHRACHDVLAHLRPELLWCFDRGKRISDELIEKKTELLKVYKSQDGVLDWFNWEHESMSKYK